MPSIFRKGFVNGALIMLCATVVSPTKALAGAGVWVEDLNFTQVNVACWRLYHCRLAATIMYNPTTQRIVTTPDQGVWGMCQFTTGIDSPSGCLTNPPARHAPGS